MAALRRFVRRLRNFLQPAAAEVELTREVSSHLDLIEDDFCSRGVPAEAARLAARRAFGGVEQTKERQRDERSFRWLEDLRRDVRYAVRGLLKTPGFTAIAVMTIALGIGANTAIFSIMYAVLLHPLPFLNADGLVRLYENVPASESPNHQPRRLSGMDVGELLELKAHSRTLSHVVSQGMALVSIAGGIDVVQRELTSVSAETFSMLGVPPLVGRWFTSEDERPGDDQVIILSDAAWQRYFGRDSHVLGKTLAFNGNTFSQGVTLGEKYTVVGVMPPSFHFPDDNTQFWVPRRLSASAEGRPRRVTMMARLADGASLETAATEVAAIVGNVRGRPQDVPMSKDSPPRFELVRVQNEIGESVKPAILVLSAAVGFVLFIACANVANLLLARTASRAREIAVRVALGVGRGRLIRQLLTESVLLSLAGGAAGILFAAGGVGLFRGLATDLGRIDLGSLGSAFPRLDAIGINAPVFVFAAAVSLATGLFFGLIPALRYARGAQMEVLRGATGTSAEQAGFGRRLGVQGLFVVAEIAIATLLFVGGGLLIHSFVRLARVDSGYDPTDVLTFQVSFPGAQRPAAELKTLAEDLVARFEHLPGVRSAAYANQLPLVAIENSIELRTSLEQPLPTSSPAAPDVRLVSRDYMKTMGIRVIAGRPFGEGDGAGRPRVLLINRTLARRDFADSNPVRTLVYTGHDPVPWEVIGVVDDVRQSRLDKEARPQFFVNLPQWPGPGAPVFPLGAYYAVRTTGDPSSVIAQVHSVVAQADPRASLENVATMDEIVSNRLNRPRMYAVLLGVFAGVGVALAATGIYGVMAFAVTARTREIGIRMALGAERGQVRRLVLRQSARLTVAGLILGFAGAVVTTKYLQAFLFGLTPLDPTTFIAVAVFFSSVAMLAAFGPARRATRIDPLIAIRHE
jgi:putative ABC transport system permease protein